ncbi:MAG: indolepyruvate oxidoreductase subunit beta [Proteobacteria bacterium]|nr:indolepyruvate oxidoreductase subunit beta [Pseudomonadota bacterium]
MKLQAHDPSNIIVSGVGGQGNILASDIISQAFCEEGYFVSVGETYGATQRGGSVVSHIRISGTRPYGPLIPLGEGHIIIGFEPLEVFRILLDYGHETVRVVMNDRPFYPLDTLQRRSKYPAPDELISRVKRLAADQRIVKGTELAKKAGHPQAQNMVMVGAFAGLNWIPLEKESYLRPIREIFSESKLEVNLKAFELGYGAARRGPDSNAGKKGMSIKL